MSRSLSSEHVRTHMDLKIQLIHYSYGYMVRNTLMFRPYSNFGVVSVTVRGDMTRVYYVDLRYQIPIVYLTYTILHVVGYLWYKRGSVSFIRCSHRIGNLFTLFYGLFCMIVFFALFIIALIYQSSFFLLIYQNVFLF